MFMTVILILILGYFIRKYKINNINVANVIFTIASLSLILLCGFRGLNVGRDTLQYYTMYIDSSKWNWNQLTNSWQQGNLDIGYLAIEFLFSNILKVHFSIFCLFCAIISICPVCYLIKKYSSNNILSLLLYMFLGMYFFNLSGIRQGLSIGIASLSIIFITKKKFILFLIPCAISTLFHFSGIIIIPMYFIANMKFNKIKILFFILLVFSLFLFGEYIYDFIIKFWRINYVKEDVSGGFGFYFLVLFIFLCALIFTYKDLCIDNNYQILFTGIMMYLLIWPVVRFNSSTFRLTYIYQLILILFIPNMLYKIKDSFTKWSISLFLSIIVIYYFFMYVYNDYNMYNNYEFFNFLRVLYSI